MGIIEESVIEKFSNQYLSFFRFSRLRKNGLYSSLARKPCHSRITIFLPKHCRIHSYLSSTLTPNF